MGSDHGPQRQPVSEVCECCESTHDVRDANGNMLCAMCRGAEYDELARLRAENERLRAVLEKFADERNWCHSLAGLVEWKAIEFPCQLAADALRGEGGEDGG